MVALESSRLFCHVPPEDLKNLREVARERSYAPGEQIFKEGDPGDGLYVVKTGLVQISTVIATGERCVFSRVPPGEVFGELSVLDSQPRSACASAEGATTVYFVPREWMIHSVQRSPALALTVMQEVTQRLREFNRQYIREVLHAERMALVGRFASSIVHDLKNPLAIISIAAELACMEGATAETRLTAQTRIDKQVNRITQLANDILEFTRGSSHPATLAPTDFAPLARSVLEDLAPEAARKAVRLEFNEPPALRLPLNPHRLSRVFFNLVANAIDAMPDGGTIQVRFEASPTEIITEIEDGGPGIAPEVLYRLFEPFTTFGKIRGTGLGLSIARRIIEEHQGTITARNQPHGGAVFRFTLPLAPA